MSAALNALLAQSGGATLPEVRSSLAQDEEWGEAKLETLRQQVQRRRADDASKRLQRDTTRRQKRRLQRESQEREILALIKQMEASKEDEMRIAMEKERISRELRNVPAAELSATEMSKKRDLQRLAKELEAIRAREAQVASQVDGIERSIAAQQQGVEDKRLALAAARQRRSGAASLQDASAMAGRAHVGAESLDPATRLAEQALKQGERHAQHAAEKTRLAAERREIDESTRKLAEQKRRLRASMGLTGAAASEPASRGNDEQGGGVSCAPPVEGDDMDSIIRSVASSIGAQTARVHSLRAAHRSAETARELGDDFAHEANLGMFAGTEFTVRRTLGGGGSGSSGADEVSKAKATAAIVVAIAVAGAAAVAAKAAATAAMHAPEDAINVRMGGAHVRQRLSGMVMPGSAYGGGMVPSLSMQPQMMNAISAESAAGDESLRRELHALQNELANQQKSQMQLQQQQMEQQLAKLGQQGMQMVQQRSPHRDHSREEERDAKEEKRRREEDKTRREKEEREEKRARELMLREQRERERQWQSTLQRQMQEMVAAEDRQNLALQKQLAAEETKQIELDALEARGLERRQQQFALREQLIGRGGGAGNSLPFTSMSTALTSIMNANAGKGNRGEKGAVEKPDAAAFGECVSSIAATAGACALLETVDPSSALYEVQVTQVKDLATVRFAMEKMQADHYYARLKQQLDVEKQRMDIKARQQQLELGRQNVLLLRDEKKVEKALRKMEKKEAKEAAALAPPSPATVAPVATPSETPANQQPALPTRKASAFGFKTVGALKSRAHRRIIEAKAKASAIPSPVKEETKEETMKEEKEEARDGDDASEPENSEEDEEEAVDVGSSVTIRLTGKMKDFHKSKKFNKEFIADLAKAAGVPPERFSVLSVKAGSIIVEFAILPPPSGGPTARGGAAVDAIVADLKKQLKSKRSKLRKGKHTRTADPKTPLAVKPLPQPEKKKSAPAATKAAAAAAQENDSEESPAEEDEDSDAIAEREEADALAEMEAEAAAAKKKKAAPTMENAGKVGVLIDRIVTKNDAGEVLEVNVEIEYPAPLSAKEKKAKKKKKKKKTPLKKRKKIFSVTLYRTSDEAGSAPKTKKKKKKKKTEAAAFAPDGIADEGAGWFVYTAAGAAVWEWESAGVDRALFAQGMVKLVVRVADGDESDEPSYVDQSIARVVLKPGRKLVETLFDPTADDASDVPDELRRCYIALYMDEDDDEEESAGEKLSAKVGITLYSADEDAPIAEAIEELKQAVEQKEAERDRMEDREDAEGAAEDDALDAEVEEPWLSSTGNGTSSSEPWGSEDGFDVYVDGVRGLPHDLVACRIGMKLLKMNRKTIIGKEHTFDFDLKSNWRFPMCIGADEGTNVAEYHESDPPYTPETTLLLRLDALTMAGKWSAVGYAALNPFVQLHDPSKQPTREDETEFALNAGWFQLPVHQDPASAEAGFCALEQSFIPRIPGLTMLLRLQRAQKNDSGLELLPARKLAAPAYAVQEGASRKWTSPYDTVTFSAPLRPGETTYYRAYKAKLVDELRSRHAAGQTGGQASVRERAKECWQALAAKSGESQSDAESASDKQLLKWMDAKMEGSPQSFVIHADCTPYVRSLSHHPTPSLFSFSL